ncbi:TerB family tellurite resistance protein [Pedobacter gandavensis]|uniref:TerB family tellurite resistance protein n=1 Tax=Pedobacter gandavensis TaxID=2679963 RepID=UPI002479FF2C|nr:TerB family tellurite resistance protein [Pedobacter gandavensis]WGQ10740.1 TerB family tellurite resistance protein [Pedobacter gandavensis]
MGSLNKSKRLCVCFGLLLFLLSATVQLKAQSTEVQQLLLNVEKLSQLKNILQDMKKGWTVVSGGYNLIRNISKGNFSLHEFFLDGLMLVSPEVKKYRRVADIITYQKNIITEYSAAFVQFRSSGAFSLDELEYLGSVYQQLFEQSLDHIDELLMVITSSKLRMSDDERLRAIDGIFERVQDKLMFLRSFNTETSLLAAQREIQQRELREVMSLYP